MNYIPEKDRANANNLKVLGVQWNVHKDTLGIVNLKFDKDTIIVSNRDVLKAFAQLFDPIGLFCPFTIHGKLFLQKLWRNGLQWEDAVPPGMKSEMTRILEKFLKVPLINPPRFIGATGKDTRHSLLGFCDASDVIYATCIYLKVENEQECNVNLVFSKARLSPIKTLTIPRLELMALLIGVRCIQFVAKEIRQPISNMVLWSDSQCVLHWLKSTNNLGVFIRNRLDEIKKAKDISFRYVHTSENPADKATRPQGMEYLDRVWWHGPVWLESTETDWPTWAVEEMSTEFLNKKAVSDKDVLFEAGLAVVKDARESLFIPFGIEAERFSSAQRLFRVTAWCFRFIGGLRHEGPFIGGLQAAEINKARILWIQYIQRQEYGDPGTVFTKDGSRGLINNLDLYQDQDGIIRCGGRLENVQMGYEGIHPILLPSKHWITQLIIQEVHGHLAHAGVSHTLSASNKVLDS